MPPTRRRATDAVPPRPGRRRDDSLDTPAVAWSTLLPLLILIGGAVVLMVLAALLPRQTKLGWHALVTVAVGARRDRRR